MSGPLSFDCLREKNVRRCHDAYHDLEAWSLPDWGCALAGEVGEVCHVVKLLRRLEDDAAHGDVRGEVARLDDDLGDELADVVIYADLLAARVGIDLGDAVRRKFNRTSEKVGSGVRL